MALSKRIKEIKENIDSLRSYDIEEAIEILKTSSKVKFNESVDLSVNLGIDATKSDQGVRGSSTLPHGIGKSMKVVAFADGEDERLAKDAGADIVGFEDLIDQVKKDKDLDADIVVATPDCMKKMGQLGRILGPKNLMPNPKEGTVTKNIGEAVSKAKKGQIRYKNDKAGIIHTIVGKLDFDTQKLIDNISSLITDLNKSKPASAKGKYMKNITISSTMGPGIKVDLSSVEKRS
ncbi:MAG: 50S ribosomal protein L1 [Gammaproteobacteria bacterium]|jgi:large subunit ribosomal protein L1|nr:50S ribosomal protein L1 [Gammaproteobacteria bacterium]MBL6818925.1 50S ribosomal protein L1 [Gammaproteobacteria bacterium]MBL6898699.1 50S ribosomal protein L1 [Gammaproteobacteria bacterium]